MAVADVWVVSPGSGVSCGSLPLRLVGSGGAARVRRAARLPLVAVMGVPARVPGGLRGLARTFA